MRFDLGKVTRNALLNNYAKDAAYRQTPEEHEALIHKYEQPGMTPMELLEATKKGIDEEKINPKYWDDESPRWDLGGSSSFIDNVEYIPSLGIAVINIGGKEYYYPKTAEEVGDFMTSDSLGAEYNRSWKLKK